MTVRLTSLCLSAFQLASTPEALWISGREVAQSLVLLCTIGKRVERAYLSNHVSKLLLDELVGCQRTTKLLPAPHKK